MNENRALQLTHETLKRQQDLRVKREYIEVLERQAELEAQNSRTAQLATRFRKV